jgi:hypothetical protein
MSIAISVSAGAKRCHPTEQYASLTGLVSLTGEAGSLADVAPVMRDLLAAAQAGCDQHLAEQIAALTGGTAQPQMSVRPAPQAALSQSPTTATPSASPAQRPAASQPYRNGNTAQRRGPAPATDSQLRFLDRLITQTNSSIPAILQQHQIGALRDLSCKAAAGLIDELKNLAVPS